MQAQLRALIPCQGLAQLLGQCPDRALDGAAYRLGAMAREGGPVLQPLTFPVPRHARQMEQHGEPRRALDQGADCRAAQTQDQISLPMTRYRPVGHLSRALADHDLGRDMRLAPTTAASSRNPERPPSPQAGGQLAPQRAASLHVQRLVDGLVADAHRLVTRKVEPQPSSNLLRAPGLAPATVLAPTMAPASPGHDRPTSRGSQGQ